MKPILMIQNDPAEGPGLLRTLMQQRAMAVASLEGEALTDASAFQPLDYAALVILGGGQGVYEQARYPYLTQEIALCRAFVEAQRPVLGVCLGAQVLAAAMGGSVQPNHRKEIGWGELELTEAGRSDPLLAGLPPRFPAFHFHGDVFTPPEAVPCLASTPLTPCQLARYRPGVYGFQFHPEVDAPLIEIMCRQNPDYMRSSGFDPDAVIAQTPAMLPPSMARGTLILERWLDGLASFA